MSRRDNIRTWVRVALPFLLYIITGSLALCVLLSVTARRHELELLQTLARENAAFLRETHIPTTDRFADYLSRVLGFPVQFQPHTQPLPTPPAHHQLATAPLNETTRLVLTRPLTPHAAILGRADTWIVLGGFWLASLALAWVVTRRLLRAERLALLGTMATQLAHEIQNPVAAIRLHAQLGDASAFDLIRDETNRLENLVNQWLFLTRPAPPRLVPVVAADLVAEVIRSYDALAHHARVCIHTEVPATMKLAADRRRLAQAIGNIVRNAIQAMPNGGTLTIRGDGNTLRFADTGPGFSPAALVRATELFYTEREGGLGVGLNVAREIVHAHGGTLTLGNQPTGGAIVCLTLPLAS